MIIKGLNFINTCKRWPEQYDVKDENGNQVAYVRLRFGILYCKVPGIGGKEIYTKYFDNDMIGFFVKDEEREFFLNEIADKILEGIEEENQ